MKTEILGIKVDVISFEGAVEKALYFLDEDTPHTIFTPNPEMLLLADKDKYFKEILNSADLVVPDGIGVVLASKLNRVKIRERVAGYDLVIALLGKVCDRDATVYFLGSAPGVAELAKNKMIEKYPGLKIIGVENGYFDEEKEKLIIKDIIAKRPDILLVGMSMGKQEKWIDKHKNTLNVKLLMGVGGCFDGLSGKVRRAPAFFCKLGLEWLYRLVRQPSRIKRQIYLPLFVIKVIWRKIKGIVSRKLENTESIKSKRDG